LDQIFKSSFPSKKTFFNKGKPTFLTSTAVAEDLSRRHDVEVVDLGGLGVVADAADRRKETGQDEEQGTQR